MIKNNKILKKQIKLETLKKREEEIKKRQEALYLELIEKCIYLDYYEFECVWMFIDFLWSILYIKIDKKTINLTFNDISIFDFDNLEELGLIEKIKEYKTEELSRNEDLRIRYKINLKEMINAT